MEIDLSKLREMHPCLDEAQVAAMSFRAALGLQRNGHGSPVEMALHIERVVCSGQVSWVGCDLAVLRQHDHNRVTEDGAEAVALAVAFCQRGWQVVRRLQREDHADWLLEHVVEGQRCLVALEVSGVDHGSIEARLSEKLKQVSLSTEGDQRWAAVVGFEKPRATFRSTEEGRP